MSRETPIQPLLSIIIPCYDEGKVIALTHQRLLEVIDNDASFATELIYVDDCSRDQTLAILKSIQASDSRVRVIAFSRNFGQPMAVTAGMAHASGDSVIVMDADLQDPPELIPAMLELWRNGANVVYGVRLSRDGESLFKRWSAKVFIRAFKTMSAINVPSDTGYFRLMDRRVVEIVLSMPERDRFLHGMVHWVGLRQEPVFFRRAPRVAGMTKYPLTKMVGFALDGIFSFSRAPLRAATGTGFLFVLLALFVSGYTLIHHPGPNIWPSELSWLLAGSLFLAGVQLVFLGVIGEYLGRVYDEVRQRPLYLVSERLGFPPGIAEFQGKQPGRPE